MPIPTDTFWNIRRLNRVFAASAVIVFLTIIWAVMQDYDAEWKEPQRQARVWDAALVTEKIDRESTPDKEARLKEISTKLDAQQAALEKNKKEIEDLQQQIRDKQSEQANREFRINTDKANLGVMESQLQDAMAAHDEHRVAEITHKIGTPRESVAKQNEELFHLKSDLELRKKDLAKLTADRDALDKDRKKLTSDKEALEKKLKSLQPDSLPAKLSALIRTRMPLFPFPTGSERVQQVVLPDVLSEMPPLRVTTVDRCTTCHINISKKEYTRDKVVGYLEEQVASGRKFVYAPRDVNKPAPTADVPGATALPEFWHNWARKLLPPAALAKTSGQIKSIAGAISKTKEPVLDDKGATVTKFDLDEKATTRPSLLSAEQEQRQSAILISAIKALYREPLDNKALATARTNALAYPDRLRGLLKAELATEVFAQLDEQYRWALIAEANVFRKAQKLDALDPTPALLAHPRLDLYVDVDSKHSFETVGCTSCHDGSGQETNFVLAAHTPKRIWVNEKTGEPVMPQELIKPPVEKHPPTLSSMLDAVYPENAIVPTGVQELFFHLNEHATEVETAPPAEGPHEIPEHANPTPYVNLATGKQGRALPQFDYWVKLYEPTAPRSFELVYHEWDWPMRPAQYLQANCVRCHSDPYQIKEEAPVVYEGRALFANIGCVNCHQMDSIQKVDLPQQGADERFVLANGQRKVGTDLRHVTAKLSPAYINTWVWAPKAFRPSTKMPHFFMLENSSSDEELKRTRQEARAITEYLVQQATPLPPAHTIDPSLKGSKEAGKIVFNNIGCLGCHSNLNERGQEWITTDLVKRAGLKADDAKATYAKMTYNERQLYALEHLAPPEGALEEAPKYADGSPKPIFQHHGPELSGIGTKLTAGRSVDEARAWLFDWVKEPRHYSDYTVMPRLRLSDQQAIDLAEYLLDQKRTSQSPDDTWKADLTPTDPEKLRELTSLFLRSRYSPDVAYNKADDEKELDLLAADALTMSPDDTKAPLERAKKLDKEHKQLVFLGKKLIGHYGCMSCHAINGAENISSPCANLSDWGQKSVDKLDFGYVDPHKVHSLPHETKLMMVNGLSPESVEIAHGEMKTPLAQPIEVAWPHVEHSRVSWITQKLKNTRIWDRSKSSLEPHPEATLLKDKFGLPYDKLKMPTFYLSDEQVNAIVTFVISNRNRNISDKLMAKSNSEQLERIAKGREITEAYNCVSCHQIELNAPPIQQYYKADELTTKAPPSLRGEGNKIQHAWLFNFLKNVEPLRPLLFNGIRMPSFPITDDQATAVAAYFAAVSNREGKRLHGQLDPVLKYIAEQKKAAPPSTQPTTASASASTIQPGDDWYLQPNFATVADSLKQWALQRKQITEIQFDPSKNKPDELAKNYHTILFKAQFVDELYTAPYPFVDSPRPEISEERFKLGEQFFYEMQCLKCHVLGDPSQPGANKNPTAPNLGLAQRRLQRRWIRHWVQEPPIIQVGTAMPPFFTGLPIFDIHGQPWPASQGATAAEVERVEAIYGKTVDDQTNLLLDFLYTAGVRGFTGVQPAASAQPTAKLPENAPAKRPPSETVKPSPPPTATQPGNPGDASKNSSAKPENAPAPRPAPEQLKPQESKPKEKPTPAPQANKGSGNSGAGGKVLLDGNAPEMQDLPLTAECAALHPDPVKDPTVIVSEKHELANVLITINGVQGDFAPPDEPVILDQNGCLYSPHVLAMMVGQHLKVKNSDKFLHNVHSRAQVNNAFNEAQGNVDPGKNVGAMKAAESFTIKCEVHPWMLAYVHVLENPYFDVTKDDGSFNIPALPPGEYTLVAWHEKYGKQEQSIKVEEGKRLDLKISFKAE